MRQGRSWAMELRPGIVDPIFMHELAERLHMTVGELCYGRGTPMSLHELSVAWPAFYAIREKQREREENKRQGRPF
jgi:hypothetical protein